MRFYLQFDPIHREGLEAPASSLNKDNQYLCKKHGSEGEMGNEYHDGHRTDKVID